MITLGVIKGLQCANNFDQCCQEECRYSQQVNGSYQVLRQQVAALEDSLGMATSAQRAAEAQLSLLRTQLQVCLAFFAALPVASVWYESFPLECLPCLLVPVVNSKDQQECNAIRWIRSHLSDYRRLRVRMGRRAQQSRYSHGLPTLSYLNLAPLF